MIGLLVCVLWAAVPAFAPDVVRVDLSKTVPFEHYWKRSFGSGHATLTLRNDWRRQLKQAIADLGLQGIRHHGIFDEQFIDEVRAQCQ